MAVTSFLAEPFDSFPLKSNHLIPRLDEAVAIDDGVGEEMVGQPLGLIVAEGVDVRVIPPLHC